jgi:hypothetical protein
MSLQLSSVVEGRPVAAHDPTRELNDLTCDEVDRWCSRNRKVSIFTDSRLGALLAGYTREPVEEALLALGVPRLVISRAARTAATKLAAVRARGGRVPHDVFDLHDQAVDEGRESPLEYAGLIGA